MLLLRLDALATKRGEGLHPILRERLLGIPRIDAPGKPTIVVADSPKDRSAKKENAPATEQERRRFRIVRGG